VHLRTLFRLADDEMVGLALIDLVPLFSKFNMINYRLSLLLQHVGRVGMSAADGWSTRVGMGSATNSGTEQADGDLFAECVICTFKTLFSGQFSVAASEEALKSLSGAVNSMEAAAELLFRGDAPLLGRDRSKSKASVSSATQQTVRKLADAFISMGIFQHVPYRLACDLFRLREASYWVLVSGEAIVLLTDGKSKVVRCSITGQPAITDSSFAQMIPQLQVGCVVLEIAFQLEGQAALGESARVYPLRPVAGGTAPTSLTAALPSAFRAAATGRTPLGTVRLTVANLNMDPNARAQPAPGRHAPAPPSGLEQTPRNRALNGLLARANKGDASFEAQARAAVIIARRVLSHLERSKATRTSWPKTLSWATLSFNEPAEKSLGLQSIVKTTKARNVEAESLLARSLAALQASPEWPYLYAGGTSAGAAAAADPADVACEPPSAALTAAREKLCAAGAKVAAVERTMNKLAQTITTLLSQSKGKVGSDAPYIIALCLSVTAASAEKAAFSKLYDAAQSEEAKVQRDEHAERERARLAAKAAAERANEAASSLLALFASGGPAAGGSTGGADRALGDDSDGEPTPHTCGLLDYDDDGETDREEDGLSTAGDDVGDMMRELAASVGGTDAE
jgi:hypothetical protein